jgi:V/A-type H+-transporting ATPase subunit I
MLLAMRRIDILMPRSRVGSVLRSVHRAGVLHLVPYEPLPDIGPAVFAGEPMAGPGTPYDSALERVVELAGLLGPARAPAGLAAELWALDDAALAAEVDRLETVRDRAARLTGERIRLDGQATRLDSYRRIVEGLRGVVGRLPTVRGFGSTGIVVGARDRAVIGLIREELERLTGGRCELITADFGSDRVAGILIYPLRLTSQVRLLLGSRDLEEVTLPEDLAGVPFDELGPRLAAEAAGLRDRSAEAERELAEITARHGPRVIALRLVLGDRIAEARVMDNAGASDHVVVLGGWTPARELAGLRARLEREVGPEVVVLERPSGHDHPAGTPVALDNGRFARAFEPLASFVSLPRYGSLDPTPLLAVGLPAFMGLMIGDAGYGLVLLALLALARRRWKAAPAMAVVWPIGVSAALATIAFGVLFGEWFGETGRDLVGLHPIWLDRREAIVPLLIVAISIGVAQVGLGLGLGVVNAALLGHRRALAGRAALLVSLAASIVVLGWISGRLPAEVGYAGLAGLVVALGVLLAALGLAGPVEMILVLGNVLSYARLMAIGLASVMLAVVAARLGGLVQNLVVGALVATLVHGLNLALAVFDSTVQGLRLHYVEFFSKFVEPGGVPYAPFASALPESGRPMGSRPTEGG